MNAYKIEIEIEVRDELVTMLLNESVDTLYDYLTDRVTSNIWIEDADVLNLPTVKQAKGKLRNSLKKVFPKFFKDFSIMIQDEIKSDLKVRFLDTFIYDNIPDTDKIIDDLKDEITNSEEYKSLERKQIEKNRELKMYQLEKLAKELDVKLIFK